MKEHKAMKNSNFKNALLGIVLAVAAAYLYFMFFFFFLVGARRNWSFFTFAPFLALYYTSWVVIPLGAALGMLVPKMAYGKSRWMAALQGTGLGAVAGLISAVCLLSAYGLWMGEGFIVMTVTAYSALWVGAYAFYRAQGQSLYR